MHSFDNLSLIFSVVLIPYYILVSLGTWEAPTIPNPEYKGAWKQKEIDNPAYKGIWVAPDIDNPDYKPDATLYHYKDSKFLGFELWQVGRFSDSAQNPLLASVLACS